jgi:hypothetical protein
VRSFASKAFLKPKYRGDFEISLFLCNSVINPSTMQEQLDELKQKVQDVSDAVLATTTAHPHSGLISEIVAILPMLLRFIESLFHKQPTAATTTVPPAPPPVVAPPVIAPETVAPPVVDNGTAAGMPGM